MPAVAWSQLCWALAFLVAVAGHRARTRHGAVRFVLGLWLGALAAHGGWLLLHLPWAIRHLEWWLRCDGTSVLFVPLGVLIAAPWREALASLPLALAVARVGCLASTCCYASPWQALPEIAGCVLLQLALGRWPSHTCALALSGFGAIRLLVQPLRIPPAMDPCLEPSWIALAWVVAGCALGPWIGAAADAPAARSAARQSRVEPLLRALSLMLAVWLLYPLAGAGIADPGAALGVASLAALALLRVARPQQRSCAARRPQRSCAARRPQRSCAARRAGPGGRPSAWVVGATLAVGYACATRVAPVRSGDAGGLELLALVVLTPAVEEQLHRGYLLTVLRDLWGAPAALLVGSALFALGHADVRVAPVAFAGGLLCGVVTLRTGSLAAAFGLHAGWNLGAAL